MAYICRAHDTAYLLHGIQVWAQSSMHGEDLLVDDGSNWQAVEAVRKCLPQLDIVPPLALIIEAVNAVDRCTFVVSSENEEVLGIFDLVRQQQADCLERLLPSIHVITKEEVVRLGREAAVFEQSEEIVVLARNSAA